MKPIIFVVFDGLGDRPIKDLGWQTPLEAAHTPNLDKLASLGITGLLHTIERGIRPGSDVAHLSILGYEPKHHYSGRGPFEAAGCGIELQTGDIAFRGNLATADKNMMVTDRRAGRLKSAEPFAKLLNDVEIDGVKIVARAGLNHRVAVALRGQRLSDKITDVDPHIDHQKVKICYPTDNSKEALFTANIVNKIIKKSQEILKKHPLNPANILLLRGAGQLTHFKSFEETYGLKAVCIAGAALYKGIARILGMNIAKIKGASGLFDTNIKGKIDKAIENLKKYDFIFVHIKAADSLAEDGKFREKMRFIEESDRYFAQLIPLAKKQKIILAVLADHTTSSELKMHTADEVPILVAGFGTRSDDVKKFGERPCQKGGLGHMEGRNLIDFLINLRGTSKLYGN